jgi:hypothetical protein
MIERWRKGLLLLSGKAVFIQAINFSLAWNRFNIDEQFLEFSQKTGSP